MYYDILVAKVRGYTLPGAGDRKGQETGDASEMREAMDESDELAEMRRDYSRRHRR